MGTFIGYEVISPVANFFHSTFIYLLMDHFKMLELRQICNDKVGIMVGAFNDAWLIQIKGLNAFGLNYLLLLFKE
jgi:hypothetical protein